MPPAIDLKIQPGLSATALTAAPALFAPASDLVPRLVPPAPDPKTMESSLIVGALDPGAASS